MHEKNLLERSRVILEFTKAEMEQPRINNLHRKRAQYERNKQQYGTARKPAGAVGKRKLASLTPATESGPAKQGRAEALPSVSSAGSADASVAQELAWEGM